MATKYKRMLSIVFVMITILLISACGKKERFSEEIFCEFYKNATYYNELQPLVCEYLNYVDTVYENSDKEDFDSFEYDADKLDELCDKIQNYSDKAVKSGDNSDENRANFGMVYYCTKVQMIFAEVDLRNSTGGLSSSQKKEIVDNIKTALDEAYDDFLEHEDE